MVELMIDKLTHCLELRENGHEIDTIYRKMMITPSIQKNLKRKGWKFDWLETQNEGNYIYALYAEGDPEIQGLISYHYVSEEDYVMVDIAESAPWNIGHTGESTLVLAAIYLE